MGRLLAALIADCETAHAAIPAIPAILAPEPASRIAESQESQGVGNASAKDQAERLLAELRRQFLPDDWIGLDHGDVAELAGLSDRQLSAYVCALSDADLRRRGKVPADETAVALCRGWAGMGSPCRCLRCASIGRYPPPAGLRMVSCSACRAVCAAPTSHLRQLPALRARSR